MEAYPASEIGEVLERISALQRCSAALTAHRRGLASLLQRLQATEGAEQLVDTADELHDRLDALELILRVQGDRVIKMTIVINICELNNKIIVSFELFDTKIVFLILCSFFLVDETVNRKSRL